MAYTGKVVRVDRGDPAMVVVKTDKTEMNVDLAPMSFVESSKLTLAADSEVAGAQVPDDPGTGEALTVATEVTSQGNLGEAARRRLQAALDSRTFGGRKASRYLRTRARSGH